VLDLRCGTPFLRSTVLTVSVPGSVADTHIQRVIQQPYNKFITKDRVLHFSLCKTARRPYFYYNAEAEQGGLKPTGITWVQAKPYPTRRPQRRSRTRSILLKTTKDRILSTEGTQQVLPLTK
jgi:hypothetical protein